MRLASYVPGELIPLPLSGSIPELPHVAKSRERGIGSFGPLLIRALLLISSLSEFSTARPVSLKFLDWPDARNQRFERLSEILNAQIDSLATT
jgi:hypothetical protein